MSTSRFVYDLPDASRCTFEDFEQPLSELKSAMQLTLIQALQKVANDYRVSIKTTDVSSTPMVQLKPDEEFKSVSDHCITDLLVVKKINHIADFGFRIQQPLVLNLHISPKATSADV